MKIINKFLLLLFVLTCSAGAFAQTLSAGTQPVSGKTQNTSAVSLRFAYLADLHISDADGPSADLIHSVKDIDSLYALGELFFVIIAGDITEFGSDQEIMRAKSILDKLTAPYYIVAGNHDSKWSESGCNTFARVFGYEHFNFEWGGIEFIGCNSGPNMRMAPALVPRESIVWLDSLTKALPADKPVIFINHYPLDDQMLNYQTVLEYIGRTNLQVALCGHGHNNVVMKYPQIAGVMGRSNLSSRNTPAGYNLITIANGKITFCERANGVTKEPWTNVKLTAPSGKFTNQIAAATTASSPVKVVWMIQDNADIGSGAVYVKGMVNGVKKDLVFYANTAGVVKAVAAADGKLLWSYATKGKIFSTPAVESGRLVVGSSDNSIYCLDATSGKLLWKVDATKSVLASPTIYKGIVYIGSSDGIFRAINLATGKLAWTYDHIKGFIEAKAWVDDQGVYIGDWASTLYAFNPADGTLLWSWTNGKGRGLSPAAVWPVKANGKVFVVTPERMTHALDATTGKEIWRAKGGREALGLSTDGTAIYIKNMQDTVIAFSTLNDFFTLGGVPSSTPASNDTKSLSAVPTMQAKSLWRSFTGYGYEIAPSAISTANGLVFIPTDKGNIFALNAADGSVAWKYTFSIALINYVQPIEMGKAGKGKGNGQANAMGKEAGKHRLLVSSMDGKVGILEY